MFFVFFCRPNVQILGALLGNAAKSNNYPYIMHILECLHGESLKPSVEFMKKIEKYHMNRYLYVKDNETNLTADEINAFRQFSHAYGRWKKKMGLAGLKTKEILKMLLENPWKQFKEETSVGIEPLKNQKTRRLWKRGHVLVKFRDGKLDDEGGYRMPIKKIE